MELELNAYIKEYKKYIGKNIKRIMKGKRKISQKEVVEKCKKGGYEISQATVSNVIRGAGNITINNLLAIAYALDVSLTDLINVEEEWKNNGNGRLLLRNNKW